MSLDEPRDLIAIPDRDDWHAQTEAMCLEQFVTQATGLGAAQAEARLAVFGPNQLPSDERPSAWKRFARQIHNLFIYVLLVAAALSYVMGHVIDALVILAVIVLNALIGFVQEGRAEDALDAIRNMIDPRASLLRDGHRITIPANCVVPGDIVLLDAGDRVPADLRLIRSRNLRIDEAILTGESVAADKQVAPVAIDAPLGDRASMAYSGTFVLAGNGAGVAIATGAGTELGRVSGLLGAIAPLQTPLLRQMDDLARQITFVVIGVSGLAFLFAAYVRGYSMSEAFIVMVGLAVAAIPEGLPAVMTIALAIGVQRMTSRNAIIRRLPVVETLGSVSVICTDKTGTLTRNEMSVSTVRTPNAGHSVTGTGYSPEGTVDNGPPDADFIRACLLCNDADIVARQGGWGVDGDPMEAALLVLAMKAGFDLAAERKAAARIDEIPFDAAYRFMATLNAGATPRIFVKGAPERIIELCATAAGTPIDPAYWHAEAEKMAARGQRVLAFATKAMPAAATAIDFDDVDGLEMLGLAGLLDPPRKEAVEAVKACQTAGIRVVMITGDHAVTAREIARQLNIAAEPEVITGKALDEMPEVAFAAAAMRADVFARTTPEHKLRLVMALQESGKIVAMTGDGVNDAPALKRADVGIAMGQKGTEVSKEASGMVLADDNFASIVAAISEGRTVYDNLRKVISWTLPTNGGEALIILFALAVGIALPVTPIQILWINMVTAVALGLTLAFEPAEAGTMQRPPRRAGQNIISGALMWRISFVATLIAIGAFVIYVWAIRRGHAEDAARTLVVNAIIAMEIFYLFSVRYIHGASMTLRGTMGTPAVLAGVGVTVAAQFAFTYWPPLQAVFGTRALGVADGTAAFLAGVALLLVVEIEKAAGRKFAVMASRRQ